MPRRAGWSEFLGVWARNSLLWLPSLQRSSSLVQPSSRAAKMVKHNNQLQKNHFRKDWQRRVKTWFDQPGKKKSRRVARSKKALSSGAAPLQRLRPAVRCPTQRYNIRIREGRGFTLSELKLAGIRKKEAKGLGIVVDHRRRSKSEEGQALNVDRLKDYRARLVVFPRVAGKPKAGDAAAADLEAHITRDAPALPAAYTAEQPRKIEDAEKEFEAFAELRKARSDARNAGQRAKRAAAKAAAEAESKK
ncbi:60S ribosomal protein L13 [Cryptotrichosporon argae]